MFDTVERILFIIFIAPKAHFPSHAAIENGHARDIPATTYDSPWLRGEMDRPVCNIESG